jgi:hypothetical protein
MRWRGSTAVPRYMCLSGNSTVCRISALRARYDSIEHIPKCEQVHILKHFILLVCLRYAWAGAYSHPGLSGSA